MVRKSFLSCIRYKSADESALWRRPNVVSAAAAARRLHGSRRPCSGLDSSSRRPCVARRWAWSSAAEVKGLAGRVAGRDRAKAAAAQACVGAVRRSGPEEFAPDRGCDGRLDFATGTGSSLLGAVLSQVKEGTFGSVNSCQNEK